MFPVYLIAALIGAAVWAVREKTTGVSKSGAIGHLIGAQTRYLDAPVPAGMGGPPWRPAEERLFALLSLWCQDRRQGGLSRHMTPALVREATKTAVKLGLPRTARAIAANAPLPRGEKMRGRNVTLRQGLLSYLKKKR